MFEMGISTLQFEHLIVGKKLEARVVDAMFVSRFLPSKCSRNVLLQGQTSMQRSVFALRANPRNIQLFQCVRTTIKTHVYDQDSKAAADNCVGAECMKEGGMYGSSFEHWRF